MVGVKIMKYFIDYADDGRITGFTGKRGPNTSELTNAQWIKAQRYNTVEFDNKDLLSFSIVDYTTQAELDAKKAKSEHAWVKSELDSVDEQLKYHWTDDRERKSHTEQAWKDYAIALRDYTSTDADGNPIVVGESRPSIENFIEIN